MPLPRLQLFELEDIPWFPRLLRDYSTDFLHHFQLTFGLHRPIVPLLKDVLLRTKSRQIVDLCSGSSGPIKAIVGELLKEGPPIQVLLTDKFPNVETLRRLADESNGLLRFSDTPIDASDVPEDLTGLRTMFNAFHHFPPHTARAILQSAVNTKQPIAIFELPERSGQGLLRMLLIPLMVILLTPFIRPVQWRRITLTYLLPLVPLTCFWDGVVSQLRAYTPLELKQLASAVTDNDYVWNSGKMAIGNLPACVTYLIGYPQQ